LAIRKGLGMQVKSWRQQAKDLPDIPKKVRQLDSVIPSGLTPSRDELIGYERISQAEEDPDLQALKLRKQAHKRERLARKAGMVIGADYGDPDHSGFYEEKIPPAFAALMDVLPQWGGLVVYHVDRVTRHPVIGEQLIRVFKANPHLRFISDDDSLDLSTEEGRQKFRDAVGKARWSSLDTSRRVADAHVELRELGMPSGKRGFGIQKDDRTKLDEREAGLIQQAVADVLTGRHLRNIADQWNVEGNLTAQGSYWNQSNLGRMLRNPRLAGWRTVTKGGKAVVFVSGLTGKPVKAIHPPIIDQDTFDQLQVALKANSRRAINAENRAGENLLSSLGSCGLCGETLHYGTGYLNCSKKGCVAIMAEPVEQEIIRQCLDHWANPVAATVAVTEPFAGQGERDRLEAKRAKTMALFHADALTPEELAEALAPIRDRIAELEADRRRWIAQTAKAKAAISNPLERWHASFASPDGMTIRRDMIRSALTTFIVRPNPRNRDKRGMYEADITRVQLVWRGEGD
jgi:DNA invertase Pin-like site-specific DNA recombinase